MDAKTKFTDSARYKCLEYLQKYNYDLSLCYCGIEECDPGHFYGPTSRTEYLLHYIIDGKGTYQINGETYQLNKHQLFLICPGVTTYYVADMQEPWKYLWIAFNGVKAKTYLEWAHLDQAHPICQFEKPESLIKCVQGILDARELTCANELMRAGYLMHFLSELIQVQSQANPTGDEHDYPYQVYVNHALEFIEHNYQKGIRVNNIADYIGINRSYLTNIFKKSLDISVQEYLINYRMENATKLLRTTKLTISEISKAVGYDDSLTFSKVFKHIKGISPTEYRATADNIVNSTQRLENNLLKNA